MKWLNLTAAVSIISLAFCGMALSDEKRSAASKACWMEAHKEYPKDSGNDVDTSGLAKDAYFHYVSCMQSRGFEP